MECSSWDNGESHSVIKVKFCKVSLKRECFLKQNAVATRETTSLSIEVLDERPFSEEKLSTKEFIFHLTVVISIYFLMCNSYEYLQHCHLPYQPNKNGQQACSSPGPNLLSGKLKPLEETLDRDISFVSLMALRSGSAECAFCHHQ